MTLQDFIKSNPLGLDTAAGVTPQQINAGNVTMQDVLYKTPYEGGYYAAPVTADQTKAYEDKASKYYNVTGVTDPTKRDTQYSTVGNLYDQLNSSGVNWKLKTGNYDAYAVADNLAKQGVSSMADLGYGANGELINKATGKPLKMRDPDKNRLDFSGAGEGHVNYVVHKDSKGNPVIVPEWETSTTNLGVLGQLAPIAASFIPGVGPALAPMVGGLTSIIQGGSVGDILKNAAIGYGAGQLGNWATGGIPTTGISAIDSAIKGGITGGIRGGLQGDIMSGLTSGAIGGAASGLSNSASQQFADAGVPKYIIDAGSAAALTYLKTGNPLLALQAAGKGAVTSGQGTQGIGGKVYADSLIPGGSPELDEGFFDEPQTSQGGGMDFSTWGLDDQTTSSADDWLSGNSLDFSNWGKDDTGNQYDWYDSDNSVDGPEASSDWWLQEEANANPEVPSDSYWQNETGQPTVGDDQPPAGNPTGLPNLGTSSTPDWLKSLIGVGGSALEGLTSSKGIAALLGALAQYAGRQKATGGGTTRGYQSLAPRSYGISQGKYGPVRMAGGGIAGDIGMFQPNPSVGGLAQGRFIKGPGDGVSDSIPAMIDGQRPAAIATEEYIIPARIVSELGNGSSEAGAKQLDAMMKRIQMERRKATNVAADTNAARHLPA